MSVIRSLTFERQAVAPPGGIYELPRDIPNGTMILNSARVDILLATPNVYASYTKSISLEIGTIVGSDYVVDNQPEQNWFKVALDLTVIQINGDHYLSSLTNPQTSFKMNGDLARRCIFRIRDEDGVIIDPAYWCFHFSVLSDK